MSRRGRGRGMTPGFMRQSDHPSDSVHPSILKQARKSGVLNLSQRGLSSVPDKVWTIQEDVPEEAKSVSLDNTDDKWWETADLTKLILASNRLSSIGEGLKNLGALLVLDVHDNSLTSLPKAIGSLEFLQKLDLSNILSSSARDGHWMSTLRRRKLLISRLSFRNQLQEIPPQVGFLSNLTSLHVEHNQLTSLCEEVCSLKNLETLNIANNQIETLPRYICLLAQLRNLNISHNKITHLPPDIGALSALRIFDATHNELANLPDEFGNLMSLEQLHLRHNQLQYLPILRHCTHLKEILVGNNNIRGLTEEHLQHLGSLICLDIRDNKLEKIPDEITLLQKLERLDLTNNDISTLPFVLGTMTSLKAIVLDGNPMRSVRRDIIMRGTNELKKYLASRLTDGEAQQKCEQVSSTAVGLPGSGDIAVKAHDLQQMKSLDYSNKKASSLPDDVVEAALEAGVKVLNLSKNALTEVPRNISVLANKLTELNLGINKIAEIKPDIAQFNRLLLLDLRNNQLSDLPSDLSQLVVLRELNIACNRLTQMPSVVYELPCLEILFANDNHITDIDVRGFSKLTKLGTLDLQNNDIAQVAPELGNCSWLKSLVLTGNPLRNPRPAILAKGTPAVLEYLRSRIIT